MEVPIQPSGSVVVNTGQTDAELPSVAMLFQGLLCVLLPLMGMLLTVTYLSMAEIAETEQKAGDLRARGFTWFVCAFVGMVIGYFLFASKLEAIFG